jgi:hypothetical protein
MAREDEQSAPDRIPGATAQMIQAALKAGSATASPRA